MAPTINTTFKLASTPLEKQQAIKFDNQYKASKYIVGITAIISAIGIAVIFGLNGQLDTGTLIGLTAGTGCTSVIGAFALANLVRLKYFNKDLKKRSEITVLSTELKALLTKSEGLKKLITAKNSTERTPRRKVMEKVLQKALECKGWLRDNFTITDPDTKIVKLDNTKINTNDIDSCASLQELSSAIFKIMNSTLEALDSLQDPNNFVSASAPLPFVEKDPQQKAFPPIQPPHTM